MFENCNKKDLINSLYEVFFTSRRLVTMLVVIFMQDFP